MKKNINNFKNMFTDPTKFVKFIKNLLAQSGVTYPSIDYNDVFETNGIIKYLTEMSDSEILFSICICRIGNISGSNSLLEENITKNLLSRLRYLLNKEFDNDRKKIKADRILIACLGNISKKAQNEIKNKLKDAVIHFWDITKIYDLTKDRWSVYFEQKNPVAAEYCKNLQKKLEDINKELSILYSNKKVKSLWDLFIDLQLQEMKIKNQESFLDITKSNKDIDTKFVKDIQKINLKEIKKNKYKIEDIINSNSNVLITGDMGSGKSTILKRIAHELINNNIEIDDFEKIPIFLYARLICSDGLCIEDLIKKEIKELTKGKEVDADSLLAKGDIVVLIDGLDEKFDDYSNNVINFIKDFKSKFPNIQLIITSRPVFVIEKESLFDDYRKFEVLPLDSNQINHLLEKWYPTDKKNKQKLLNVLKKTALINTLPKTPLTVTLLAIIFEEEDKVDEIPANITELYNKFIDVFTGRWDASKGISMQDEFSIRAHLIKQIAFYLHYNNTYEIEEYELSEILNAYILAKGYDKINKDKIFNDLLKRIPLFIKKNNCYKFIHPSFQEYYASHGIRQTNEFIKDHHNFLVDNFLNPWWSNVILFYVGDIKDCPDFLKDVSGFKPKLALEIVDEKERIYIETDKNFLKIDNLSKIIQAAIATDIKAKTIALDSALITVDRFRNNLINLSKIDIGFNAMALKIGLNELALIHIIKELFVSLFRSKYTRPSMLELFYDYGTAKRSFLSSYVLANCLTDYDNDPKYLLDFMGNENVAIEWKYLSWGELNSKFTGKLSLKQKKLAKSIEKKVKKNANYLLAIIKKMDKIPRLKEKVKLLEK